MLKIFTTQLTGFFQRIQEKENSQIEDAARLLAQAAIGEGAIYVKGWGILEGIYAQVEKGESFPACKPLPSVDNVTAADRVLLFTPFSTDLDAIDTAQQLAEKGIPTVGVSAAVNGEKSLQQFVDIHVDSKLTKPIIPTEHNERIGFPVLMTSLYVYYCLFLTVKEILEEYEE
ncbi:DUF2529 domain-containing protein [Aeribacillus sp. FSL K6-1305]|uniref:DUF2529 domain-containing protein n=1 Tax=Aeribacillus sp. FSL K6-1305 TaxID=2954569 RepID=UPI0030FD701D